MQIHINAFGQRRCF